MAGPQALAALSAHLKKATYSHWLLTLDNVETLLRDCYLSLDSNRVETFTDDAWKEWVIVCTPKFVECGPSGPLKPARVVFHPDGSYAFQVLLATVTTGMWKDSDDCSGITSLLDMLLANSGYVFCPGIVDYGTTFGDHVCFQWKNLRAWNIPHTRTDSTHCELWHKPVHTNQKPESPTLWYVW